MKPLVKHALRFVAVVAVAALGVGLYVKTQPRALDHHAEIVSRFGALTTLDSQIATEALAVRQGLAPNYDALTRSTGQFRRELALLEEELSELGAVDAELSLLLEALETAAAERSDAVERFKSGNSVLRNSLSYLPLAARQTNEASRDAASSAESARAVAAATSELVELSLAQATNGGRDLEQLGDRLRAAKAVEASVPSDVRERFRLFLAHVRTVLLRMPEVDGILKRDVLNAEASSKLAAVESRYGNLFDRGLADAARYRAVLYGWSILLLVGLIGAGLKLRSVYGGLARLVAERTQKLSEALSELWGEMQLAKKIQTALLPRELVLRDCEVAAVMRPTEQVGGDYYDVFEAGGVEWVLIGDVSGHGVPSGLVMMMCQTAVRSVLAARPDVGPDELLALVNRTLTENIARLGEDKYMTISALRRERDGSFRVAGMHQDLLVYRAATARVEHLPAQGTWLGIFPDIKRLNPVRTVRLAPFDVLVLYTDGITEARRAGQMLDVEGLKRTLGEHGGDGAEALLGHIMASLEGYEVFDDVAAVVIKQLESGAGRRVDAA